MQVLWLEVNIEVHFSFSLVLESICLNQSDPGIQDRFFYLPGFIFSKPFRP